MKKRALIAAITLATCSHYSFAQEEQTACMSEPQKIEISSKQVNFICDAVSGGEAKLVTRDRSKFARFFLNDRRKALVREFGTKNEIRPLSRRSSPYTENDEKLINELIAAFEKDQNGETSNTTNASSNNKPDSEPKPSTASSTNSASISGRVSSDGTNTLTGQTQGDASASGTSTVNGETTPVSVNPAPINHEAAPTEPSTPSLANTSKMPANKTANNAPDRSRTPSSSSNARIRANSADRTTQVDTATMGNANLRGSVNNNGTTQTLGNALNVSAPMIATTPPSSAPSSEETKSFESSSRSTVRISANSADNTVDISSNIAGNARLSGTVNSNGTRQQIGSPKNDTSDAENQTSSTPDESTAKTMPRVPSSSARARITASSADDTTDVNTSTSGNARIRGTVSNNGNKQEI